jgi:hypothetical protein
MRTISTLEATQKRGGRYPLVAYGLERATLLFSLKMALIVGTLLAVINHGQAIITGHFTSDRLFPLLLTYCVPFAVALYSQIQGKRQRDSAMQELLSSIGVRSSTQPGVPIDGSESEWY